MIIEPRTVNLGHILKSIPYAGNGMKTFNDRLRLQKIIYMVEAFRVYLGYDFSWYLRGPYCTRLAKAGFELEQIADRIADDTRVKFADPGVQKKFEQATKFIGKIMKEESGLEKLEVAASIHFLAHTTNLNKQDIFSRVIDKMAAPRGQDRREEWCLAMWDMLSKEGLMEGFDEHTNNKSDISVESSDNVENIDIQAVKEKLAPYDQYADIGMLATIRDFKESLDKSGKESSLDLELNERPAFAQRPNCIARLLPEESKENLITEMMKEYL